MATILSQEEIEGLLGVNENPTVLVNAEFHNVDVENLQDLISKLFEIGSVKLEIIKE